MSSSDKAGFDRRHESVKWTVGATVEKWSPEQVQAATAELGHAPSAAELAAFTPPETIGSDGNLLTTAGLTRIMTLITGTGQAATPTSTRLGVGNSATAEAVGQTDLQAAAGAANRYFMTMDGGYPSVAAGVLTARAVFGTGDANFAWAEWGLDIGTPTVAAGTTVNAVLLNRKVASLGTKVAGSVWTLTTTITLA